MPSDDTSATIYSFLPGGGEMGDLIRAHDWSLTSIGTADQWTPSLRSTLSLMLHSRFPMFLFWGAELLCFYNDAYRPSLGVSGKHPSALGKPAVIIWPEIWDTIKPLLDQVMNTGEATWSEDMYIPFERNGRIEDIYWTFSYSPIYDEAGKPAGVFTTCFETTKAVHARQQLQESHRQTLKAFDQAPVGVALIDTNGLTHQMANQFYANLFDRREDALIGQPLATVLPELIEQGFDRHMQQVIDTGATFVALETAIRLTRGGRQETIYVDLTYQPQYDHDGNGSGVIAVVVDATTRVLNRLKLEAGETRFRSLIEEAPVATCLFIGPQFRVEVANQVMIDLWGKGWSVLGKPLVEALPELEGQPFIGMLERILATGEAYSATNARAELVVGGVLGTYYYNFTYKPLFNPDGTVYGIMDMAVDVTEQVLARQKLEESEGRYRRLSEELDGQVQMRTEELVASNEELRVSNEEIAASNEEYAAINEELEEANSLLLRSNENLEKFAYVASHDLQEPLRKIQQFGDLLKSHHLDPAADEYRYLERMQLAAGRMSTLIRDLLNFSRISVQRDTSAPVSLDTVVGSVLTDLELTVQETGAIIDVAPLPTIPGDPLQLGQLFLNLLSNALKFRKPGQAPRIRVTSEAVTAHELPPAIKPSRGTRVYYRIDVADNGIGFDDKYLDRIFQVFQRLHGKSEYAGTGIGLAICEKVAANHGGGITASSQPGQGATFSVYLPS